MKFHSLPSSAADCSSWLDTELFGPLPVPAQREGQQETAAILARARELASRSKAEETRRSYKTSWTQWQRFCDRMGYQPLAGDVQAVGLFLAHLSRTKSVATIRNRLAAVAAAHRVAGVPLDLKAAPIANVLEGFKRERGVRPGKQATPLLFETLPRFLETYGDDTATNRRDKALLLVGFAGAFRRSELVALNDTDLEFTPQGVIIHLRRSKTDQQGIGDMVAIHRGTNAVVCAVSALEKWIEVRPPGIGALFTRMYKGGRPSIIRLRPQAVSLIIKRAVIAMGVDARRFSGHSLRAGLATSAGLAGADVRQIMAQTRHRSYDVALGYIRHAEIWRDNVTELLFRTMQKN